MLRTQHSSGKLFWNMQKFWNVELSVSCNKIVFFTLFIHEDKFIIEGIHFKLHWLLSHIVLLVVEIFVTVACRLYNLFMPVPFWSVWLHSATPFIIFFNPVHSAMSEMHQKLALQFQRTVMTCPIRLPARLLAIMFENFLDILGESRKIPGQEIGNVTTYSSIVFIPHSGSYPCFTEQHKTCIVVTAN
jgi:hypothetical protein